MAMTVKITIFWDVQLFSLNFIVLSEEPVPNSSENGVIL
jgi:hypothetical protein